MFFVEISGSIMIKTCGAVRNNLILFLIINNDWNLLLTQHSQLHGLLDQPSLPFAVSDIFECFVVDWCIFRNLFLSHFNMFFFNYELFMFWPLSINLICLYEFNSGQLYILNMRFDLIKCRLNLNLESYMSLNLEINFNYHLFEIRYVFNFSINLLYFILLKL